MEVITEIMKAGDADKGRNAKPAEKLGAHGSPHRKMKLEAVMSTVSLPVGWHYQWPRWDAEYLCQLHSLFPAKCFHHVYSWRECKAGAPVD